MNTFISSILTRFILCLLLGFNTVSYAQQKSDSPIGKWTTIDDVTGETKGVVQIYQTSDGTLSGKILKTIPHPDIPPPVKYCDLCSGERKEKPVVGMVIMWNMTQEDEHTWSGGTILDPKNGNEYRCKLTLLDNGNTMEVRGYIGFSLLGRSQTWIRNNATNQ